MQTAPDQKEAGSGTAVMLLLIMVTEPFNAKALPNMLAPSFRAMLVLARILPLNDVPALRVAEEPTCQNTLSH